MTACVQQFVNYFMPDNYRLENPGTRLLITQNSHLMLNLLRLAFPNFQIPSVRQNDQLNAQKLVKYYLQLLQINPSNQLDQLERIFVSFVTNQLCDGLTGLLNFYNEQLGRYNLELNFNLDVFLANHRTTLQQLEAANFSPVLEDTLFRKDFYDFRLFCYLFGDVSANIAEYQRLQTPGERTTLVFKLLQANEVPVVAPQEFIYGLSAADGPLYGYLFVWQHLIVHKWFMHKQPPGAHRTSRAPNTESHQQPIMSAPAAVVVQPAGSPGRTDPELMRLDNFISRASLYFQGRNSRPLTQLQQTYRRPKRNVFLENRGIFRLAGVHPRVPDTSGSFDIHVEEVAKTPAGLQIDVLEESIGSAAPQPPRGGKCALRPDNLESLNLSCIQKSAKLNNTLEEEPDPFQELQNELTGQAPLQDHDVPTQAASCQIELIDPNFGTSHFNPESLHAADRPAVRAAECANCRLTYLINRQYQGAVGVRLQYLTEIDQLQVRILQSRRVILQFASQQIVNVNGADAQQTLKFMFRDNKEIWIMVPDKDKYQQMCELLREGKKML